MAFGKQTTTPTLGYLFALILSCHPSLASPVPEIFPPEAETLSFTELTQKAFLRILELGLFRGVAVLLLILAFLTCLLIGTLRALAIYLHRYDTQLWETYEEVDHYKEDEKDTGNEAVCRRSSIIDERRPCNFRPQTQSRVNRYILSNPSTPVTRINVHAWSRRAAVTTSPPSPCQSRSSGVIRSPSSSLRSALSKSPQSFLFSSERVRSSIGSSPSPKSVRWADQLHASVTSTLEMSMQHTRGKYFQHHADEEMDITTRSVGNSDRQYANVMDMSPSSTYPMGALPACEMSSPGLHVTVNALEPEPQRRPGMQLEGDTS